MAGLDSHRPLPGPLYDDTPSTDATKPLIGYIEFGADVSTTAGVFTSVWDAAGIIGFTTP